MVATSFVVPAVVVGQQNSTALQNNLIGAVQELQSLVNGLEAQPVMELQAGSQSIPNLSWTAPTFSTTPGYAAGSGLTATSSGIRVLSAGRYQVIGQCVLASNASGYRFLSAGQSASFAYATSTNGVSGNSTLLSCFFELSCAVNDTISLWVYQTSGGGALTMTSARISLRQMTD